jgi:hypothetical protein
VQATCVAAKASVLTAESKRVVQIIMTEAPWVTRSSPVSSASSQRP